MPWRSGDALGQGDEDALGTPHVAHPPDVLVLPDAAHEREAVRPQSIDGRVEVIHLEADVAQSELGGGRGLRPPFDGGSVERAELQAGAAAGYTQHDDLGPGVGDTDDRVQELALHDLRRSVLLESQLEKERRHRLEIVDGDTDVVESSYW